MANTPPMYSKRVADPRKLLTEESFRMPWRPSLGEAKRCRHHRIGGTVKPLQCQFLVEHAGKHADHFGIEEGRWIPPASDGSVQ